MRADQALADAGLAASRAQAQRLIAAGVQWRASANETWQQVKKNSEEIPSHAQWLLPQASETQFVSRGGLKLTGALQATGLSVQGKYCLDVGQSTGGFSDCLLQHGAAHVLGVDVGHGQLHPRLRTHPQVTALEGINARELDATHLITAQADFSPNKAKTLQKFSLIVGDLSFISLTLVLPRLAPLLAAEGHLLMLVKPQFELQPGDIGKGGIVRDARKFTQVEDKIRSACTACGLQVLQWLESPITGGDGNREFFVCAQPLAGFIRTL